MEFNTATFSSQTKALQWCERLMDSKQNFKNNELHTFTDDQRHHRPQSKETNCVYLNPRIRLNSSCIPPVDRVQHRGQIKSWQECSCGRHGLQLNMEPTVQTWKDFRLHFVVAVCEQNLRITYAHSHTAESVLTDHQYDISAVMSLSNSYHRLGIRLYSYK